MSRRHHHHRFRHHLYHHHHHHHRGSHTNVYDYDPKKNRQQKMIGIAMALISVVLFVLSPFCFLKWNRGKLGETFALLGIALLVIGLSQVVAARKSKKTSAEFVKCLDCGTVNKNGSTTCKKCGKPIRTFCPQCGAELNGGSNFCSACGHTAHFEE